MYWPGFWVPFDLGNWYIPIAVFIIVGMTNAVNLTDGLDGLAGLIAATAFAAYGAIAIYQSEVLLGRFCFTVVGSCLVSCGSMSTRPNYLWEIPAPSRWERCLQLLH